MGAGLALGEAATSASGVMKAVLILVADEIDHLADFPILGHVVHGRVVGIGTGRVFRVLRM